MGAANPYGYVTGRVQRKRKNNEELPVEASSLISMVPIQYASEKLFIIRGKHSQMSPDTVGFA